MIVADVRNAAQSLRWRKLHWRCSLCWLNTNKLTFSMWASVHITKGSKL